MFESAKFIKELLKKLPQNNNIRKHVEKLQKASFKRDFKAKAKYCLNKTLKDQNFLNSTYTQNTSINIKITLRQYGIEIIVRLLCYDSLSLILLWTFVKAFGIVCFYIFNHGYYNVDFELNPRSWISYCFR